MQFSRKTRTALCGVAKMGVTVEARMVFISPRTPFVELQSLLNLEQNRHVKKKMILPLA